MCTDAPSVATSVLGNVTSSSRVASQVSHLQDLAYGIGYVDSSSIVKNAEVNFSPYLSGYLLEALGQVNVTGPAKFLLDGIWTAMAKPGPMYSGGGWEYVVRSSKGQLLRGDQGRLTVFSVP